MLRCVASGLINFHSKFIHVPRRREVVFTGCLNVTRVGLLVFFPVLVSFYRVHAVGAEVMNCAFLAQGPPDIVQPRPTV